MQVAWYLYSPFKKDGEFFHQQLYQLVTIDGKDLVTEEEAFSVLDQILICGQKSKTINIISVKKERMIVRSGLTNHKRLVEAQQISKMKASLQTRSSITIEISGNNPDIESKSDHESKEINDDE